MGWQTTFYCGRNKKSLLFGVIIVGPAIAVAIIALQVTGGWLFN
ncbi:hypothetical protein [Niallia sp. MER TA 168]|nr:hypothetical protein [Niallia sp. MER TA 168]